MGQILMDGDDECTTGSNTSIRALVFPVVEFLLQSNSAPSQDGSNEEAPALSVVCPSSRGQVMRAKAQYSSSLKKKSSFDG